MHGAGRGGLSAARQGDRFILVEGALLLHDEDVAGLGDVKVYLDASKETCASKYLGNPKCAPGQRRSVI